MILIHNDLGMPFITGDQPVINTYAVNAINAQIDNVEFYYPVSPTLAILISDKEEYRGKNRKSFTLEEVHLFNNYNTL